MDELSDFNDRIKKEILEDIESTHIVIKSGQVWKFIFAFLGGVAGAAGLTIINIWSTVSTHVAERIANDKVVIELKSKKSEFEKIVDDAKQQSASLQSKNDAVQQTIDLLRSEKTKRVKFLTDILAKTENGIEERKRVIRENLSGTIAASVTDKVIAEDIEVQRLLDSKQNIELELKWLATE